MTITATALASAKSGTLPPLHIMLVIDNTGSMNNTDPTSPAPTDCGVTNPTRIQCALAGAQALISELWPTQDEVGMMVFAPMTSASAADDATCNGSNPTLTAYGASGSTYQVLTFAQSCPSPGAATCYKTSNTATTLNSSSPLAIALCAKSGQSITLPTGGTNTCTCKGDKVVGGEGTYLAGAINATQNVLNANSVSGVQNVMIVLSDGGAGNAGSHGAPASNECINSITAAENAANAGTWIYSIAYGSLGNNANTTDLSPNPNGCSDTETPPVNSCYTMSKIASDPTKFYSDPMGAGGSNNVDVNTFSLEKPTNASTSWFGPTPKVLNFASGATSTVQVGMGVQDVTPGHTTYIPASTTVTATIATTVTMSNNVTAGDTIPSGDEIQFAYSYAGSTVLYFSSVPATVKAGMGVADATNPLVILAGTTVASINTTATTVTINPGEGGISQRTINGVQPNDQIVFSPTGNCTSQDNPTPTDLVSIFNAIGQSLSYTQLLPLTCISSGANTC